jgi:hypothetical protein
VNKKRNVQIFGGTQKYFGGTQVEKHCTRPWLLSSSRRRNINTMNMRKVGEPLL